MIKFLVFGDLKFFKFKVSLNLALKSKFYYYLLLRYPKELNPEE